MQLALLGVCVLVRSFLFICAQTHPTVCPLRVVPLGECVLDRLLRLSFVCQFIFVSTDTSYKTLIEYQADSSLEVN